MLPKGTGHERRGKHFHKRMSSTSLWDVCVSIYLLGDAYRCGLKVWKAILAPGCVYGLNHL